MHVHWSEYYYAPYLGPLAAAAARMHSRSHRSKIQLLSILSKYTGIRAPSQFPCSSRSPCPQSPVPRTSPARRANSRVPATARCSLLGIETTGGCVGLEQSRICRNKCPASAKEHNPGYASSTLPHPPRASGEGIRDHLKLVSIYSLCNCLFRIYAFDSVF